MVRISGPRAGSVLETLAGGLPPPRVASLRTLRRSGDEAPLDQALTLWFPGPATATGEDLAELHLHGGRAVVAAVLAAVGSIEGLRPAEAGQFTRRAFENGRIDLAEAEGLADLIAAETETQRQSALALAEGGLGRRVSGWQRVLLRISAQVEAELDFSDEGDVGKADKGHTVQALDEQVREIRAMLAAPPAERLRDGVRVVLAGPPNAGKSSLFNALVDRNAAIVSEIAGTTRDRIEAPVAIDGVPLLLIDTAGLRAQTSDAIEAIGIGRAESAVAEADVILWLGAAEDMPAGAVLIAAKADIEPERAGLPVSVRTGEGMAALRSTLLQRARALLPTPGALALNERHRAILADIVAALEAAQSTTDPLIVAEHLREARAHLDRLTGRAGVEDMLDALFGALCIGK